MKMDVTVLKVDRNHTSTPLSGASSSEHSNDDQHNGKAEKNQPKVKQPMLKQICEAIETVGIPRKGASYLAIKNFILSNNAEANPKTLIVRIKKTLQKGIDENVLDRPAALKDITGARGHFILAKSVTKPEVAKKPKGAVKKQKTQEQHESDNEAVAKKVKVKKRNLSGTAVKDLEEGAKPEVTKRNPTKPAGKTLVLAKKNSISKATKTTTKNGQQKLKIQPKPRKKKTEVEERRDVSDSEVVVKKKTRKSLKSYSSDTEVSTVARNKTSNLKPKRAAAKKTQESAKSSETKKDTGPRKLFNAAEEVKPEIKPEKRRLRNLSKNL